MCRVLGVCRSWFHAWRRQSPARAVLATLLDALVEEIRAIFEGSKQRYGAPRIHAELQGRGHRISKKTVAKLMKMRGLRPPRRKRRMPMTTDSRHTHAIAPNLLDRHFKIMAANTVWLADLSYIPTDVQIPIDVGQ
jgi:transposase InsO family protein